MKQTVSARKGYDNMGKKLEHWLKVLCKDDSQPKLKSFSIKILTVYYFLVATQLFVYQFVDNNLLKMGIDIISLASLAFLVVYFLLLVVITWIRLLDDFGKRR